MEWYDFFGGQLTWQQAVARQQANFQAQAAYTSAIADQKAFTGQEAELQGKLAAVGAIADQQAYAALQDGPHTGYVRQAMDRYRRAPNVSQHWLDAMLDIELGLFQP